LAAVAVTGGAFAQATLTGDVAYGFTSSTAANSTTSGFGLEAADLYFNTSEAIEGVGTVAANINIYAAESGRGSGVQTGDVVLSLTTASGVKLSGGSTQGASYLSQGVASAGTGYEWNLSGKITASRTNNDFVAISAPLMEGTKVTYNHTEADVSIGTGSAAALNAATQSYDTLSLDYTAGPLAVNVQARTYNGVVASSETYKQSRSRFAASYDMGVAKIGAGVEATNFSYGNTQSDTAMSISIPLGALNIGGQIAQKATSGSATSSSNYTRTGSIFGGTYNLSKRTYVVGQMWSFDAGNTTNTTGYGLAVYNTF
jgi:hypothetical protein